MAFPTALNSQITDAVTQSNVKVLGDAPAQALASLYQSVAAAISLSLQNSVAGQQQGQMLAQSVTTRCVAVLTGAAPAEAS